MLLNSSTTEQGKVNDVSRRVDLMAEKDDEFKPEQLEAVSTMSNSLHISYIDVVLAEQIPKKCCSAVVDVFAVCVYSDINTLSLSSLCPHLLPCCSPLLSSHTDG